VFDKDPVETVSTYVDENNVTCIKIEKQGSVRLEDTKTNMDKETGTALRNYITSKKDQGNVTKIVKFHYNLLSSASLVSQTNSSQTSSNYNQGLRN
jgi:hypothetical protein